MDKQETENNCLPVIGKRRQMVIDILKMAQPGTLETAPQIGD